MELLAKACQIGMVARELSVDLAGDAEQMGGVAAFEAVWFE